VPFRQSPLHTWREESSGFTRARNWRFGRRSTR
jgi:hypothetical protein